MDSFTERIEVHNNDKSSSHCYAKVDVYFTAVGMINIPTEREILAMMEELQKILSNFVLSYNQKNGATHFWVAPFRHETKISLYGGAILHSLFLCCLFDRFQTFYHIQLFQFKVQRHIYHKGKEQRQHTGKEEGVEGDFRGEHGSVYLGSADDELLQENAAEQSQ